MRFREDAGDAQISDLVTDGGDPLGAGCYLRADRDRSDRAYIETVLEILIGVVKNHEPFAFDRLQGRSDFGFQLLETRLHVLSVGFVGCAVGRIRFGQRLSDLLDEHLGIARVQPQMHVELTVRMIMMIAMRFRLRVIVVVIMGVIMPGVFLFAMMIIFGCGVMLVIVVIVVIVMGVIVVPGVFLFVVMIVFGRGMMLVIVMIVMGVIIVRGVFLFAVMIIFG